MTSAFFAELIKEINKVRTNPSSYIDKILGYKKYFKGNVFKLPDAKIGMKTEEGFAALEDAANFLKTMKPIEAMIPSKGLGRIASDYLEKIKHVGPDQIGEIEIDSSINKFGNYSGTFNTIMDFGSDTPELVLMAFLASDGDETRNNREFILDPELKRVGVAREKHMTYGMLTIVISCTEFQNTFDSDDTENYEGLFGEGKKETAPTPTPTPTPKTETNTNINTGTNSTNVDKATNASVAESAPKKDNATNANNSSSTTPAPAKTKKNVENIVEPLIEREEEVVNEIVDPDVVSCDRRERFVIQFGRKKKKVIFMKKYKDGHTKKEVKYFLA